MNNSYDVAEQARRNKIDSDRSESYELALEAVFVEKIALENIQTVANTTFFSGRSSGLDNEKLKSNVFDRRSEAMRVAMSNEAATSDLTNEIATMLRGGMANGQSIKFTVHMPKFGQIDVSAVNNQSAFLVNIKISSLALRKLLKSKDKKMAKDIEAHLGKRTKVRVVDYER